MKITTWNINGIRAALGKEAFKWLIDYQPDVVCLQEIKAKEEQIDTLFLNLWGINVCGIRLKDPATVEQGHSLRSNPHHHLLEWVFSDLIVKGGSFNPVFRILNYLTFIFQMADKNVNGSLINWIFMKIY